MGARRRITIAATRRWSQIEAAFLAERMTRKADLREVLS